MVASNENHFRDVYPEPCSKHLALLPDSSLPHTTGHRCKVIQVAGEWKGLRVRNPKTPLPVLPSPLD